MNCIINANLSFKVDLKLEKVFGYVKNVCKVKFENISDASHLFNEELQAITKKRIYF